MKKPSLPVVAIGASVLLVVILVAAAWPRLITNSRLNDAMAEAQSLTDMRTATDLPEAAPLETIDGWGRPFRLRMTRDPEKIVYDVYSTGPDGEVGTEDDIHCVVVDKNLARSAGKWVGEKSKQFLKGLYDGVKKDSEYDKK